MSELLPSREAEQIRDALTAYLTTTFALSDADAQRSLKEFLTDPDTGIFRGPFVRARVPFRTADDGWRDALGWYEGHTPYGHQAAAFRRLSSSNLGEQPDGTVKQHPLPTLVVTGTGSGKTEAFLYPILDHVLRAKAAGTGGVKALILYPMNALANDQARRIAEMIRGHDALKGIRAALYTGDQGGRKRTRVTDDGLINHPETIRDDPPDILLTNYKMLDQVLLRPADRSVVEAMAQSMQYLVLDEFHTYDGAQGTDVAMLLRRLGLALRRHRSEDRAIPDEFFRFPLADVTPVATSATLGDDRDPSDMLSFAETVFGRPFTPDSVINETRQSTRLWIQNAHASGRAPSRLPAGINNALVAAVSGVEIDEHADSAEISSMVLDRLYPLTAESDATTVPIDWAAMSDEDLLAGVAAHPLVHAIARAAEKAVSIDELADEILPRGLGTDETFESRRDNRRTFLTRVFAMLSHVRARVGRSALSIDLNLWVRELTRIDRAASAIVRFSWSDDGPSDALLEDDDAPMFPAIYCRHCGRSGWGVELAPTGSDLSADDESIRRNHASRETRSRFRALLHAPGEAESAEAGTDVTGLAWFDPQLRRITTSRSDDDASAPHHLPVLTLLSDDAGDDSRDDVCPACQRRDGIRFLGSAMATMLSVIVTTLFGDAQLDQAEKKALVFTDSVQDAAHRAGFVQSRAHVFALRNAIRQAIGDQPASLDEIVTRMMQDAGDDKDARYRLVAPELVERDDFMPFWSSETLRQVPTQVRTRISRRLLFDVAMEFGLHSRVGRTLELTGSLAAGVDASDAKLEALGRKVLVDADAETLDGVSMADVEGSRVLRWVRGVLERMRERGSIEHEWFAKYISEDGRRWNVWGGRPRGTGMPAFPPGREAPAFPRVGPHAPTGTDGHRTHLDVVSSSQSWFATWARRTLSVTPAEGAALTSALLAALTKDGLLHASSIATGSATVYAIPPASVIVTPVTEADLAEGSTRLVCDVCQNPITGTAAAVSALRDGPCMSARCPGTLRTAQSGKNYYRGLYDDGQMRRVVAREHTGLLDDDVRLKYENAFKSSDEDPSAPNVLVATPTLEMGIDIGDLSTVMLAGLPRSVASYLQRVGRAGRLTGNALSIATVTGRGDQLPRMGDPLSVINGAVRPPATYLDAQEIVQRQYIASLLDRRTGAGLVTSADTHDVLASSERGTLLGELIEDADSRHREYVDEFLTALGTVSPTTSERLRSFVAPTDGIGTSPLADTVRDAVQRWNRQIDVLAFRRKEIADAIPDLEAAVNLGLEADADEALRTARITHRMLGRQLNELHTDHWVSSLERFGLLPNYTLLDDSVTLDAAISWVDPETGDWREDPVSYERGASVAIQELAPGAYFYAQGLEILVDAVDLGPGGEAVQEWSFCSRCGHGRGLTAGDGENVCPRCGAKGINDVAQRLRVVELDTVSAIARRDEASINDRSDDRIRTRFTVQAMADLDPAGVARRWFDESTHFGVTYARDLTLRWINLGRQSLGGESRVFGGQEHHAPLFRVCDTCGKLDSQSGGNHPRDHRSWCPRRRDAQEHTIAIALSRTLVTQGTFLRLPIGITLGDSLAVPSLSAALMRGLREVMGGDPDHLRVISTVEPVGDDTTAESLLVHDAVPGGTGYLAELADPDRMFDLLRKAWEIVRDCDCRDERRSACHRCLLPYARGNTALVSRASAEQALAKLLQVDAGGNPRRFTPTEQDPGVVLDESTIEQLFRKRFIERAQKLGGTVKEKPGDWGNKVQVSFPGDARIWKLSPQVSLGFTKPDFVLEQHGGGAEPVAIYTDGRAFHASTLHNRLADDAKKRELARAGGHRVLAVTWADLQDDDALATSWVEQGFAAKVAEMYQLPLVQLDRIHSDPLTTLMEWMQDPAGEAKRRDKVARALPMMTRSLGAPSATDTAPVETAADALRGAASPSQVTPLGWVVSQGAVAYATRMGAQGASEFAVVIDDRDEALRAEGFAESWRLWLHLSNVVGWRFDLSGVEIKALSQTKDATTPNVLGAVDFPLTDLSVEWQEIAEKATPRERPLIAALAARGDVQIPEMGLELGDGIPFSFVWRDARVAATWGLDDDDRETLSSLGWTAVEPELNAVISALAGAGGN
ncbi:DEAD/DEAH box helicase [Microbacterium sp. MAHUQ-60]|uniref:DEAD/DEAH box helicase n=1 Tax=unclassified Microbacterium TaxID=2609290 RepID=UPI003615B2B6